MKILNDKQVSVLDTLIKSANTKPSKEPAVDGRNNKNLPDKVELSSRRQEIDSIKERVKASPAIRQDKVDQMKLAIKTETYNVKGELVAKSILKNNLLDTIF